MIRNFFCFFFSLNLLICQLDIKNVMSSVVFWRKLELGIKFELGSQMDIDLSLVLYFIVTLHCISEISVEELDG